MVSFSSWVTATMFISSCLGMTVWVPSWSSSSSEWNQELLELRLIMSSLRDLPSYPRLTFTQTAQWSQYPGLRGDLILPMGYSRSGVMIISNTRGGLAMEHSKCLRSMNLLRGSYHCIRNTPPGRAPQRYL